MPLVPQIDRLELPMERCQLGNNKDNYKLENKSIGDDFMDNTIPWGVQCLSGLKRLLMI